MMQTSNSTPPGNDPIQNLKKLAAKTGDLPPIPAMAIKALQMMQDPMVSVRDLQSVIVKDQALAAKILRIVNSAMYCLSREISTLSHAIAILGMETVRSIIMAASVQHVYQTGMVHGHDLGTKILSDHSWGAAICSRIIAQKTRYPHPEEAFLCGLIHDIGKPVMLKNLTDRYTQIVSDAYRGAVRFFEAEMEAFGFSHAHVGALLTEKWNFPPQLSEGIGCHHNPLSAQNHRHLACVVNLANLVMTRLEIGFEKDKNLDLNAQPSTEILKLSPSTIEEISLEVPKALEKISDSLKF
jgi:putative nucleotidyltransferase with HDIG domain